MVSKKKPPAKTITERTLDGVGNKKKAEVAKSFPPKKGAAAKVKKGAK